MIISSSQKNKHFQQSRTNQRSKAFSALILWRSPIAWHVFWFLEGHLGGASYVGPKGPFYVIYSATKPLHGSRTRYYFCFFNMLTLSSESTRLNKKLVIVNSICWITGVEASGTRRSLDWLRAPFSSRSCYWKGERLPWLSPFMSTTLKIPRSREATSLRLSYLLARPEFVFNLYRLS